VPHPALLLSDRELLAECDLHTLRGSGPGGQKRNKTESAVRIRHKPTGVTAVAEESRSQAENRRRALRRLREALALRVRARVPLENFHPPAELASSMDAAGRVHLNERDAAYAVVVATVLDVLDACQGRLRETAQRLDLPTNRLTRFLAEHPRLWQATNRIRTQHRHSPLKSS
jgi:hypothetical protein